jgi:hypothetical protein
MSQTKPPSIVFCFLVFFSANRYAIALEFFIGRFGDGSALGTQKAPETLGAGYGQDKPESEPESEPERSPTKTSLKRGSLVVRPMSISSMPGTPRSLKRSSIRYQCCF